MEFQSNIEFQLFSGQKKKKSKQQEFWSNGRQEIREDEKKKTENGKKKKTENGKRETKRRKRQKSSALCVCGCTLLDLLSFILTASLQHQPHQPPHSHDCVCSSLKCPPDCRVFFLPSIAFSVSVRFSLTLVA
jgi:hypothetical protein